MTCSYFTRKDKVNFIIPKNIWRGRNQANQLGKLLKQCKTGGLWSCSYTVSTKIWPLCRLFDIFALLVALFSIFAVWVRLYHFRWINKMNNLFSSQLSFFICFLKCFCLLPTFINFSLCFKEIPTRRREGL